MVIAPEYCRYKWGIQLLNKYRGSFILPPQTTLKGCPLKIYTHWHCLILKKVGNLMISAIVALPLLLMVQKSGGHQLRRLFSLSHHLQGFIYTSQGGWLNACSWAFFAACSCSWRPENYASVFQPWLMEKDPAFRNGSSCIITIVILRQSDIYFGIW